MSERPDNNRTLWQPADEPNAWRAIAKPTPQRRRVRLRPTLPGNVPEEPENTGGWHLPDLNQTTARPAPKTASPEAIALGLIPDEATITPEDTEIEITSSEAPQRPEDIAQETTPEPDDTDVDEEAVEDALDMLDDDEEGAFTMSELIALQNLADESGINAQQGESLDLDVTPSEKQGEEFNPSSLSPAERAAIGLESQTPEGSTQEAEIEEDTGAVPADQFDYASQLAALQGESGDGPQAGGTPQGAEGGADDPQSYAQRQLAALQGEGDAGGQQGGPPQEANADQFDYAGQLAALQGDAGGDTQSLENTPSMPAVDPEREALAQQFNQTEQQVRELRQQRDSGMISQAQFESALRELMIFDEREQVWWMMGADTEIWYKYDQNSGQWVVAEPPQTAAEQQAGANRREQNIMTPDTGMRQVGDLEESLPRVNESDDWDYSQRNEPQPQFDDSYQMPQAVPPRDEQATIVGDAAFKTSLSSAQETVPNMPAYDEPQDDYASVESAIPLAPDYEQEMGEDLSGEIELAQRRRNRQMVTTIVATLAILTSIALLLAAGLTFYVYSQYQGIKDQWTDEIAAFGTFQTEFQTVVIQDINGNEIARLRSEDGGDRTNVDLENISPEMIHAIVSTENERFFSDPGWDPVAIARAFLSNLAAGEVVSGGSTITQQLARNIILRDSNTTFANEAQRKLHEIVISHELAQQYDKNGILEVYLNEVYFGNQKYGVEAASEFYFDHGSSELNLAESAMLAGLVQSPAAYDPVTNPSAAFNRLDEVVRLMAQAGNGSGCLPIPFQSQSFCVNQQTLEGPAAINIAEVKTTVYLPERTTIAYPHFVTFVQQQLQTQFTQEEIFRRGFVVRTTLRPEIQDSAQNNLENYVDSITTTGVNTGTAMVTNPDTGAIIAMIGSPDFNDESIDGQVNLSFSWQQPGSAIKPVVYAAALEGFATESGPTYYTPATILWDVPTTYGDAANTVIRNFDGEYHGPQSARSALQNSYNVPAVKTYAFIGNQIFQQVAQSMGLRFLPEAQFNLTTGLGSTEVRLYDMMEAYGTLSNDGVLVPLYAIEEITDAAGTPIEWQRDDPSRAIQESTAFLMQNILSDNQSRATEFGANNRLAFANFPNQVAAKTGTTNDSRDLWTLGFTDDVVVGVWLGHVDNNPTFNTSGYSTASPLWRTIMENVLNNTRAPSQWNVPANIVQTQYCATTGTLLDQSGQISCNDARTGFFTAGQLPPPPSEGFVQQVQVNTWTGQLANEFCPNDTETLTVASIDDPTAIAWLRDNPNGQRIAQQIGFPNGLVTAPNTACDANTPILQAGILQPQNGSVVTTPVVTINGNISSAPNFASYDIQIAPASSPNQFQIVDGPYQTLPVGQRLGEWDASNATDGQYIIRLGLNSTNGGYAYRTVNITLDKPEPTPTPTPLSIPTAPPLGGGGNPGGGVGVPGGAATPTLLPFDNNAGTFGAQSGPTPTATIDFGG